MRFLNLIKPDNTFIYSHSDDRSFLEFLIKKNDLYYHEIFSDPDNKLISRNILTTLTSMIALKLINYSVNNILTSLKYGIYELKKNISSVITQNAPLQLNIKSNECISVSNLTKEKEIITYFKNKLEQFRKENQKLDYQISFNNTENQIVVSNLSKNRSSSNDINQYLIPKTSINFSDVVGLDEVKTRLCMINDYFKDPEPYKKLRVKPAMQLLLYGPPGCGKTMIAKAFSNYVNFPFFSLSAAEITSQKYAGFGAILLRKVFEIAKQNAPSVIFLDEIDAFGNRSGFKDDGVGFDARSIMNSLLVLLDGIDSNENIIVIAATNRIDDLDPALLRPKRFGTKIKIDPMNTSQRESLARNVLSPDECEENTFEEIISLLLSRSSSDFSPALLENLIHEAKLKAISKQHIKVSKTDFLEVIDDILLGKTVNALSAELKISKSYNESGFAILHRLLFPDQTIEKISIQYRSNSFGETILNNNNNTDEYFYTDDELLALMVKHMGAVMAEKKKNGKFSIGSSANFMIVSRISSMIAGNFDFEDGIKNNILNAFFELGVGENGFPDELRILSKKLIDIAGQLAMELIDEYWEHVVTLAEALIKHETLEREAIHKLTLKFDSLELDRKLLLSRFKKLNGEIGFKRINKN